MLDRAGIDGAEPGEELVGAEILERGFEPIQQTFRQRGLPATAPAVDGDHSRGAGRLDAVDAVGQRVEERRRIVLGRARPAIEPRGRQLR
jgi:hypothetical protein